PRRVSRIFTAVLPYPLTTYSGAQAATATRSAGVPATLVSAALVRSLQASTPSSAATAPGRSTAPSARASAFLATTRASCTRASVAEVVNHACTDGYHPTDGRRNGNCA